jgi:hypothetical protein
VNHTAEELVKICEDLVAIAESYDQRAGWSVIDLMQRSNDLMSSMCQGHWSTRT